ncbi:PIR Superfamily Protein [Plasmodium ovale curtisi]|uniref:PIR Superfamily Protein n=1 Tax=Plasmodium ovale curtisi TaxID=864141 RepID=A0A1A8WKR2_PLAOA|nr:PIR Superfamily Protein [Plasmodium ovale curtisi]
MTGDISEAGSEELSEYTPKELYSELFYRNREIPYSGLHNHGEPCNKIYAQRQRGHMIYLCKIVLKYLEQSTQWEENKSEFDDCMLLNYWLYDKLSKYFVHDKDYIKIAYANIENIWSNLVNDSHKISYYKKCKPLFNEILKYDNWKRGKELYDYCINYKYIEKMCPFYSEGCAEYCEYVEKRSYLYDYFEKACDTKESYCPHFYDECKGYNPNKVLKTLKCPDKIKTSRAAAPEVGTMHHSVDQGLESPADTFGTELTHQSSEIGKKVGHSVLGIAPFLLSATALYRYTPMGSWIRKLGGSTTNNMSDADGGEMEEFLGNTQESSNMFFDGRENFISYQPT